MKNKVDGYQVICEFFGFSKKKQVKQNVVKNKDITDMPFYQQLINDTKFVIPLLQRHVKQLIRKYPDITAVRYQDNEGSELGFQFNWWNPRYNDYFYYISYNFYKDNYDVNQKLQDLIIDSIWDLIKKNLIRKGWKLSKDRNREERLQKQYNGHIIYINYWNGDNDGNVISPGLE